MMELEDLKRDTSVEGVVFANKGLRNDLKKRRRKDETQKMGFVA